MIDETDKRNTNEFASPVHISLSLSLCVCVCVCVCVMTRHRVVSFHLVCLYVRVCLIG